MHSTKEISLVFRVFPRERDAVSLRVETDADHGGDKASRRSTSGVLVYLEGARSWALVAWQSKLQSKVSRSTAEAELQASVRGLSIGMPLKMLAESMMARDVAMESFTDPSAALANLQTGLSRELSHLQKWSAIDVAWAHEKGKDGVVKYGKIDTDVNTSDIMTKPLKGERYKTLRTAMGLTIVKQEE